jgi:PAS domain S-box-containing protein
LSAHIVAYRKTFTFLLVALIFTAEWKAFAGSMVVSVAIQESSMGSQSDPSVRMKLDQRLEMMIVLLKQIAHQERWDLQFVKCHESQCTDLLRSGRVDLLVAVQHSRDHEQELLLSRESVVSTWAQVGTAPGIRVQSWIDLDSRSLGVIAGDPYNVEARATAKSFGVNCRFVDFKRIEDMLEAVHRGWVDAMVVDRFSLLVLEKRFSIQGTPIVFAPLQLRFASSKAVSKGVVEILDYHLRRLKEQPDSLYYRLMEGLLGNEEHSQNHRLLWMALGGVALVALALGLMNRLLRRQVRIKTEAIASQYEALKTESAARLEVEQSLRLKERRLSLAISATADAVWEWNVESGQTYYSPRWYEMLGYSNEQFPMTFEAWKSLVHPEDFAHALQKIDTALAKHGGTGFETEFRMRNRDGSWNWILARGNVVERDAEGRPLLMSGTNTDITERKLAEDEKAKLQTDLLQAQKMESVGRLAGGVAHDFNNMLGVIIGNAELALNNISSADQAHGNLQEIVKAAERSANLIRQLLGFARKQTISPIVLDINGTVASMLKMVRRLIGENIELLWKPGRELWPVKADPTQIDQVLANLCVNARDAIAGVGSVLIETGNASLDDNFCRAHPGAYPGDYIRLTVSDDGCGMEKEVLDNLFEPFFTTKQVGRGTGLGLATVYGIVKQNNGYIEVCSQPGCGTTFHAYLPRTHVPISEEQPSQEPHKSLRGTETVLLVEDEDSILQLSMRILEQHGYLVLTAHNPSDALELAKGYSGKIDLLLTDVIMPGMNGKEFTEKLGTFKAGFRCIFMSGYTDDVIAQHGGLDKGVHFLQKPFSIQNLAAKIREVLDAR